MKQGPKGDLGKGTPGSRLKGEWRKAGRPGSLKRRAREAAKESGHVDAIEWLKSKGQHV